MIRRLKSDPFSSKELRDGCGDHTHTTTVLGVALEGITQHMANAIQTLTHLSYYSPIPTCVLVSALAGTQYEVV